MNLQETTQRQGEQGHLWPPWGEGQGIGEAHLLRAPPGAAWERPREKANTRHQVGSRRGVSRSPLPARQDEAFLVLFVDIP